MNGCDALIDLAPLAGLAKVTGEVSIGYNDNLTDVSGLNLSEGAALLVIRGNPKLDQCLVLDMVAGLPEVLSVHVEGNGPCQ